MVESERDGLWMLIPMMKKCYRLVSGVADDDVLDAYEQLLLVRVVLRHWCGSRYGWLPVLGGRCDVIRIRFILEAVAAGTWRFYII